jgi:plasmid stabilization system protein ParE
MARPLSDRLISGAGCGIASAFRINSLIVHKSRDVAKRAIKAIRQGVKILASHPEIGRPVDELPPEFREWVIEFGQGAYVVLYSYDGKEVVLLAIRHGREAGY